MCNSNSGGFIGTQLKYLRGRKNKQIAKENVPIPNASIQEVDENETATIADKLSYLKYTIIDKNNMEIIKEHIRATAIYRYNMLMDKNIDLLENFPFFFTHPALVNIIFS